LNVTSVSTVERSNMNQYGRILKDVYDYPIIPTITITMSKPPPKPPVKLLDVHISWEQHRKQLEAAYKA